MVIVFALLAALSNAVNEATQHIASTAAPRKSSGRRLIVYLFHSPLWLFGWVALIAAFVFQALALHNGQISKPGGSLAGGRAGAAFRARTGPSAMAAAFAG